MDRRMQKEEEEIKKSWIEKLHGYEIYPPCHKKEKKWKSLQREDDKLKKKRKTHKKNLHEHISEQTPTDSTEQQTYTPLLPMKKTIQYKKNSYYHTYKYPYNRWNY